MGPALGDRRRGPTGASLGDTIGAEADRPGGSENSLEDMAMELLS